MRKIDTRDFRLATRATQREINRQIALNLVREHQPISRAELARRMAVGRGTVSKLVNGLIADGMIYEGPAGDAPRGRKPKMLYVRTHDRLAVAVDLRFSRTYLALTDLSGTQIALETFPTCVSPPRFVEELAERIRRLLATHQNLGSCEGIGLVIPGMVDRRVGRVLNAPQLGWRNVDIRDALADATGLPVHIENGPMACALSKLWLGRQAGTSAQDFAYFSIFDGVGVGVVVNGQIVRGYGQTAGEFGHIPLDPNGPRCLCGARGCLEAHTSDLATLSRYFGYELAEPSTRARIVEAGLTVSGLIARARTGDERARRTIEETGRYIAAGVVMIVHVLSPQRIYIGGEIAGAWDLIEPFLRAALEERALTEIAAATPIIPDLVTSNPRLLGATALVAAPVFAAPEVA